MPVNLFARQQDVARGLSSAKPRTGHQLIVATKQFAKDDSLRSWWCILSTSFLLLSDLADAKMLETVGDHQRSSRLRFEIGAFHGCTRINPGRDGRQPVTARGRSGYRADGVPSCDFRALSCSLTLRYRDEA